MPKQSNVQLEDPPRGPQIPRELERKLARCRTNADTVEVLLEWGFEHGFVAADAPAADKRAGTIQYRICAPEPHA